MELKQQVKVSSMSVPTQLVIKILLQISQNAFANMSNKVFFSQDTKTDNLTFNSNYYFEAPSLLSIPEGGAGKVVDATGVTLDPGFTDAANGNFKVSNQTIIDNEIGDPRWRK